MKNIRPVVGRENRPASEFETRATSHDSAYKAASDKVTVCIQWLAIDSCAGARKNGRKQRALLVTCVSATAASTPITASWNKFCGLEKSCDKTQINQYRLL